MIPKPFTVQVSAKSVTFTEFTTVPGAAYLAPVQSFRIPIANWRELVRNGGPEIGSATYCNFSPEQLQAHGVSSPQEPQG
jgi:hypothetical protein